MDRTGDEQEPPAAPRAHAVRTRSLLSSWVTSVALHAGLLFWLTVHFRGGMASFPGPGDGGSRDFGLYMHPGSSAATGTGDSPSEATATTTTELPAEADLEPVPVAVWEPLTPVEVAEVEEAPAAYRRTTQAPDQQPVDPGIQLTGATEATTGAAGANQQGDASDGNGGASVGERPGEGGGGPNGPGEFFGLRDEGSRFVYVLDHSDSMGFGKALSAAKSELLASLDGLAATQEFQVIFYSDTPVRMRLSGESKALFRATKLNRKRARQFIDGIQPAQSTRHMPALRMALQMKPDAVFFLTDADYPGLSAQELDEIVKLSGGRTRIHCIEFDRGRELDGDENFLRELARRCGGAYRYCDVLQFTSGDR